MAANSNTKSSTTRTSAKPGSATDSARPRPGAGSQAEERGHDIVPPPGGSHSGQDSGPSRTGGRGSDRGTRTKP